MNAGAWLGYLALVIAAAGLALALTPVARSLAHRVGAFDRPGGYKLQVTPIPYLGGVAIVVAFALIAITAVVVLPEVPVAEPAIILGLALAFVRLYKDLTRPLPGDPGYRPRWSDDDTQPRPPVADE